VIERREFDFVVLGQFLWKELALDGCGEVEFLVQAIHFAPDASVHTAPGADFTRELFDKGLAFSEREKHGRDAPGVFTSVQNNDTVLMHEASDRVLAGRDDDSGKTLAMEAIEELGECRGFLVAPKDDEKARIRAERRSMGRSLFQKLIEIEAFGFGNFLARPFGKDWRKPACRRGTRFSTGTKCDRGHAQYSFPSREFSALTERAAPNGLLIDQRQGTLDRG